MFTGNVSKVSLWVGWVCTYGLVGVIMKWFISYSEQCIECENTDNLFMLPCHDSEITICVLFKTWCHAEVCQNMRLRKTENENYTIYPEGLHRAIVTMTNKMVRPIENKTGKHLPIYVTENGIGSAHPKARNEFFHRYLYALDIQLAWGLLSYC